MSSTHFSNSVLLAAGSSVDTPEKPSASRMLLDWKDNGEGDNMERPSCSTYSPEILVRRSSFSQIRTKSTSPFPAVPKKPQCNTDQEHPASKLNIIVISSPPHAAQDSCSGMLSSGQGGNDGAEEVSLLISQGNTTVGSQCQPLHSLQIQESTSEAVFEADATYSDPISIFRRPAVTVGTVDSQEQQTPRPWSGIQSVDNFPSRNLYQVPCSHNQETGLAQPQEQHPSLPYGCNFCSRRYAHQCQLRIHERVHTGEKPYQCAQCGKSFGQVCSLKRHQMVHTGERPFPCPHCGKQFSTSTNLKVHQSVHTGEKRFHCSKCGKNFSFLSNLIRHQALHTAVK